MEKANVVITGASSGIGKALSLKFCQDGKSKVLGIARREERLKEFKRQCSESFEYLDLDLSNPSSAEKVRDYVAEKFSPLGILVNNAGYGLYKGVLETNTEEVINMTNVNFVVPILLIKELSPYMEKGSMVVNVLSGGVFVLMTKLPLYGATKMAFHYASEALKRELKTKGIDVLNVYPGVVETEFHERAGGIQTLKGLSPEEVANAIYDSIKKRKKNLFIPWYLRLAKLIFGPALPSFF
ncbi:MAG: SDR family NAD(P)-dependent oxidoreductase [Fervidicoccaceae archaeon]